MSRAADVRDHNTSWPDIFAKCADFTVAREAIAAGIYPFFLPMTESEGTEAVFAGVRMIMCGSNNYLGLTTDARVRQAAVDAVNRLGTSCTGSRFLNGTLALHEELEGELATFLGKEAALVFATGMQANLGVVSSLVCRHDVVVVDQEAHASIHDGATLAPGRALRFRHNDVAHLERVLTGLPDDVGRLVVVDGVYSMGGDLAPLPGILAACRRHGARLLVDDAHGLGVLGGGRGTPWHFGVSDEVDLVSSTFSKSLASLGGFVAGEDDVVHYVKHHARSMMFSASLPPGPAAAALAALRILRAEPGRVARLAGNAHRMRTGLVELGFDIGSSTTPIVPIVLGDDELVWSMWRMLFADGVFVNPVVWPGVAEGKQLLRTSYMATHTDHQLDRVLEAMAKAGRELGVIG